MLKIEVVYRARYPGDPFLPSDPHAGTIGLKLRDSRGEYGTWDWLPEPHTLADVFMVLSGLARTIARVEQAREPGTVTDTLLTAEEWESLRKLVGFAVNQGSPEQVVAAGLAAMEKIERELVREQHGGTRDQYRGTTSGDSRPAPADPAATD